MYDQYGGIDDTFLGVGAIIFILFFFAVVRVLNRAGISGWWSLVLLVPIVNIVAIWTFAFARWPSIDDAEPSPVAASSVTPARAPPRRSTPPPPPPSGGRGTSERIAELDRLRAEGVITADEYERKRRDILDSI